MKKIIVVDFGSKTYQLILSTLEELKVGYVKTDHTLKLEDINEEIAGIILSGSPDNISDGEGFRLIDERIFDANVPILGICYGHQLSNYLLGGKVIKSNTPENGLVNFRIINDCPLFKDMPNSQLVHMSHNDEVVELGSSFEKVGETKDCNYAASYSKDKNIYTLQFHPEYDDNTCGKQYFINFLKICKLN